MYSKTPIFRPPLGLSRSGLISGVVLITDIKYKENLIWDRENGIHISRAV